MWRRVWLNILHPIMYRYVEYIRHWPQAPVRGRGHALAGAERTAEPTNAGRDARSGGGAGQQDRDANDRFNGDIELGRRGVCIAYQRVCVHPEKSRVHTTGSELFGRWQLRRMSICEEFSADLSKFAIHICQLMFRGRRTTDVACGAARLHISDI